MESLTPTCSKGEEEALVRVLLQQRLDPPPHPLVPLVDELLSEVSVDLLRRHLLAGWQRHIIEVRNLRGKQSDQEKNENSETAKTKRSVRLTDDCTEKGLCLD